MASGQGWGFLMFQTKVSRYQVIGPWDRERGLAGEKNLSACMVTPTACAGGRNAARQGARSWHLRGSTLLRACSPGTHTVVGLFHQCWKRHSPIFQASPFCSGAHLTVGLLPGKPDCSCPLWFSGHASPLPKARGRLTAGEPAESPLLRPRLPRYSAQPVAPSPSGLEGGAAPNQSLLSWVCTLAWSCGSVAPGCLPLTVFSFEMDFCARPNRVIARNEAQEASGAEGPNGLLLAHNILLT